MGKKTQLGKGLEPPTAECEGTSLCFQLLISPYLLLNPSWIFFLGLRPQECLEVQEGWGQDLNCRPPH